MEAVNAVKAHAISTKMIISVVVVILFMLAGLVGFGITQMYRSYTVYTKASQSVTSSFLQDIQAHNYKAAHMLLTQQTQVDKTVPTLQKDESWIEARYGRPTGKPEAINWNIRSDAGVVTARLFYEEQFRDKKIPVEVDVVQVQGKWMVQDYHFQL